MKLATIRLNGRPTVIARVTDSEGVALNYAWMEDLIEAADAGLDAAASAVEAAKAGKQPVIDLSDADWMAPNPRPSKILGCAVNNNELNRKAYKPMTAPMFFIKGRSALTGHNKPINLLKDHGQSIPEPEPVIVFGKSAKNIEPSQSLDYVFGYTLTNDITASGVKFSQDAIALKADSRSHQAPPPGLARKVWRERHLSFFYLPCQVKGCRYFRGDGAVAHHQG